MNFFGQINLDSLEIIDHRDKLILYLAEAQSDADYKTFRVCI